MKVIHVSQRDDVATGGALRVAYEFVKRLPSQGIDARMLFLYGGKGPLGAELPALCDYLELKSSAEVIKYRNLVDYLRNSNTDIVHFHDDLLWPQLVTAGSQPWRRIIHAHGGGTPPPQPLKTRLLYYLHRQYGNVVVCITEEAKASQTRNVGYDPARLFVIYNGVDACHFSEPTHQEFHSARLKFGLPSDAPVIGFVGRLHDATKGCKDFLRVISLLGEAYWALIVGSGPDDRSLRSFAEDLGIEHRVVFSGLLEDPSPAFHAMSAFGFTSYHEGFGLSIAEAMASGVPVVGFSCPGGSQEILFGATGAVIAQRDLEQMKDALIVACSKDSPWPERIQTAKQLLHTQFNWDVSVRKLAELYGGLVA